DALELLKPLFGKPMKIGRIAEISDTKPLGGHNPMELIEHFDLEAADRQSLGKKTLLDYCGIVGMTLLNGIIEVACDFIQCFFRPINRYPHFALGMPKGPQIIETQNMICMGVGIKNRIQIARMARGIDLLAKL